MEDENVEREDKKFIAKSPATIKVDDDFSHCKGSARHVENGIESAPPIRLW